MNVYVVTLLLIYSQHSVEDEVYAELPVCVFPKKVLKITMIIWLAEQ